MSKVQWLMKTEICPLYLVASEDGLQGVHFRQVPKVPFAKSLTENKTLAATVKQLEEYFEGQRTKFDLPMSMEGTDFQKRVWLELTRIPYGKTKSYKDVACKIKNDKAMRAVGTANGRNPIAIIVPCHRVIAHDGTLGGYGGGLPIKVKLLELESRHRTR